MLLFVDSRFINDSDEFGKSLSHVSHWLMPLKTNKNVTDVMIHQHEQRQNMLLMLH